MFDSKVEGNRIRRIMYGDKEFRRYMDEVWGLDLLGHQGRDMAHNSSLDPYYFWEKESIDKNRTFIKIVE